MRERTLIRPKGATKRQQTEHEDRKKLLYEYLFNSIGVLRLRELIATNANKDGREAFLILDKVCEDKHFKQTFKETIESTPDDTIWRTMVADSAKSDVQFKQCNNVNNISDRCTRPKKAVQKACGFTNNVVICQCKHKTKQTFKTVNPNKIKQAVQIIEATTPATEQTSAAQPEQDENNAPAPSAKHEATNCQKDQYERTVAQTMQAYAETCKFHKKTCSQPNDTTLASKKSDFVIPNTMKAALHDMRFAPQWRVAIRNEFYKWKDAGYKDIFTTGKWTFKINTNKAIEMIYFKASCEMPEPIISEMPQQCEMQEPKVSDMPQPCEMPEPIISEVRSRPSETDILASNIKEAE